MRAGDGLAGADAGQDRVGEAEGGGGGGDEAAEVGEVDGLCDGFEVDGFSGVVGAGEEERAWWVFG